MVAKPSVTKVSTAKVSKATPVVVRKAVKGPVKVTKSASTPPLAKVTVASKIAATQKAVSSAKTLIAVDSPAKVTKTRSAVKLSAKAEPQTVSKTAKKVLATSCKVASKTTSAAKASAGATTKTPRVRVSKKKQPEQEPANQPEEPSEPSTEKETPKLKEKTPKPVKSTLKEKALFKTFKSKDTGAGTLGNGSRDDEGKSGSGKVKLPTVESVETESSSKKTRKTKKITAASLKKETQATDATGSQVVSNTLRPHHDMQSYLSHLHSTKKSPISTTARGTIYEYATIHALSLLGISSLIRTGRSGDNGVDLVGTCNPLEVKAQVAKLKGNGIFQVIESKSAEDDMVVKPKSKRTKKDATMDFNVIIQCKASEKSVPSILMREMAGAYFGFVHGTAAVNANPLQLADATTVVTTPKRTSTAETLVMVVTAGGRLTDPATRQLEASQMPMMYLFLENPRCKTSGKTVGGVYNIKNYDMGRISQFMANSKAKEFLRKRGLEFRTVRSYSLTGPKKAAY